MPQQKNSENPPARLPRRSGPRPSPGRTKPPRPRAPRARASQQPPRPSESPPRPERQPRSPDGEMRRPGTDPQRDSPAELPRELRRLVNVSVTELGDLIREREGAMAFRTIENLRRR